MKWTTYVLAAALCACSAGDDTAEGTRALCAEGGALNECHGDAVTPRDACWRLVDCGAIPVHRDGQYELDWDRCVSDLEGIDVVQQELVVTCINASTCDQLKNDQGRACRRLGSN